MKLIIVCFMVVVFVVICFGQSGGNQKYIGTWGGDVFTYTFNANGTYELVVVVTGSSCISGGRDQWGMVTNARRVPAGEVIRTTGRYMI